MGTTEKSVLPVVQHYTYTDRTLKEESAAEIQQSFPSTYRVHVGQLFCYKGLRERRKF